MQTWVAHPVTATSNFQLSKSQRLPRYGNADEAAPQAGSRKSPADPREAPENLKIREPKPKPPSLSPFSRDQTLRQAELQKPKEASKKGPESPKTKG